MASVIFRLSSPRKLSSWRHGIAGCRHIAHVISLNCNGGS
jgi:hypothetical protein